MKGVLLGIAPTVRIVDLTHDVAPQQIEEGAFHLRASIDAFPSGAVHVAVVDPGVGTSRRALCVAANGALFVGPDNGLFSLILPAAEAAWAIDNPAVVRPSATATFHGRDLFAPAAAHLAAGSIEPHELGQAVDVGALVRLAPAVVLGNARIAGRVVSIDRFGNCITLIERGHLEGIAPPVVIQSGGFRVEAIGRTFADVAAGGAVALIGSSGTLELAVRQGSAAGVFGIRRGDTVTVQSRCDAALSGHASR